MQSFRNKIKPFLVLDWLFLSSPAFWQDRDRKIFEQVGLSKVMFCRRLHDEINILIQT